MKKYEFETSNRFDEMVKDLGLEKISDLDIGEEALRQNVVYKKLETWEYENGVLEIYAEEIEEEQKIDELLEKKNLTEDEINFLEESQIVEFCKYEGLEFGHDGDYLYHVKLYGQDEIHSVTTER